MARKRTTKKGGAKRSKKGNAKRASSKRSKKATGAKRRPDIAPRRRERGEAALALRKKGMSWAAVGAKLGVSGSYARNTAADIVGGTANLPPITD